MRSNPALFAALMSPPTDATPSDDPNVAGLATHNGPGAQMGKTIVRSTPQSVPSSRALGTAIASAPAAPMPYPPHGPRCDQRVGFPASWGKRSYGAVDCRPRCGLTSDVQSCRYFAFVGTELSMGCRVTGVKNVAHSVTLFDRDVSLFAK